MQIAAAHLKRCGYQTVTFTNHLSALANWFPGFEFATQPANPAILAEFDLIILEHDNSPKAIAIRSLPKTYSFFPSYVSAKHGPLRKGDLIFDRRQPMAKNIAHMICKVCPGHYSLDNGICPPDKSSYHRYPKRVAIHPLSSNPEKNWRKDRFLKLADALTKHGWEPMFIVPPEQAAQWKAPIISDLDALAQLLYESGFFIGNDSGPGHLASNLGIPTLTIGPTKSHLDLWRPGWAPGKAIAPSDLLTKFKLIRRNWPFFLTVDYIFQQFILVSEKHSFNQLKSEKEAHNERSTTPQTTAE